MSVGEKTCKEEKKAGGEREGHHVIKKSWARMNCEQKTKEPQNEGIQENQYFRNCDN